MDFDIEAARLGLSERHLRLLMEESGISIDVIEARGYRTIGLGEGRQLLDLGFKPQQFNLPAMLIPLWNVHGKVAGHTIRLDDPGDRKKYCFGGKVGFVDVHPLTEKRKLRDGTLPLFITEGGKKNDAMVSQGAVVVNVSGVWNWRGRNEYGWKTTLPDWDEIALDQRNVIIVFDSDLSSNPNVRAALDRFVGMLQLRGAVVYVVFIPQSDDGAKQGADDFLKSHSMEDLEALAKPISEVLLNDPLIEDRATDVASASRFSHINRRRAFWCQQTESWFVWDGTRWNGERSMQIDRWALETVRFIQARVQSIPPSPQKEELWRYAISLEQESNFNTMVRMARASMEVSYTSLDVDPWLLNCQNGTVDLRTGELKPHDPDDYITRITPVAYDPDAKSPRWEKFLDDLMGKKQGLADFVQQAVGYSTTGVAVEEKLFMVIGQTRTGKSTFMKAVKDALGDYSQTADFGTFLKRGKRGANEASEDLARLAGVRMVSSVEVDETEEMAVALVKQLTGNDQMLARFMYKGLFTFEPTMKLWLVSNHEPKIDREEEAAWERVLIIPFTNQVPPEKRDLTLKEHLSEPESQSAILAWAVKGCMAWYAAGRLTVPNVVMVATAAYRERMDPLTDFFYEHAVLEEKAHISKKELYARYAQWARESGLDRQHTMSGPEFSKTLEGRGFVQRKMHSSIWSWEGIGLIKHDEEADSRQAWQQRIEE